MHSFGFNAHSEMLFGKTVCSRYEIGSDINNEVGSKILSSLFDYGKLPSHALRVNQLCKWRHH